MIQAGKLDRLIDLQHRTLGAVDQHGEHPVTYTTYATVWAEKRDLTAREFFANQQVQAEKSTRWRVRHRADVLQTDRIVAEGVNFDIVQISEIGRREGLEIFVRAVA